MFKSIIKFLKCETTITKPCRCGKQANGICTAKIEVSRTGILSQKSNQLLQCGKVQEQAVIASRIVAKHKSKK